MFAKLRDNLDINRYNGASFLGLKGIVIKSHGSSSKKSFESSILQAMKEIKYNIPEKIESQINIEGAIKEIIAEGKPEDLLDNQQVREVYLGEEFRL